MHPVCSLVASIDLADEVDRRAEASRARTPSSARAFRATTWPPGRWPSSARAPARTCRRSPSRSGSGCRWRPGSAGVAPTLPPRCGSPTSSPGTRWSREELRPHRRRPRLGRAQPARPAARAGAGSRRARSSRWSLPPLAAVLIADADGLSTAAVYAELDRLDGAREAPRPGVPFSASAASSAARAVAGRSTTICSRQRSRSAPTSRTRLDALRGRRRPRRRGQRLRPHLLRAVRRPRRR